MTAIQYRPEIDGLRAVAVIPVILFHMDFDWIAGGFLGVDVFFVISGFLITSILKKEIEDGAFSFRKFWARRIRRILPVMIVVTAATLAVTYSVVFKPDQAAIGRQSLAALFSVANVLFWRKSGDYWGTNADDSPFLHMWSLSVEEQFYLFFPIVMWLTLRFRPRWLQGFMLLIAALSLSFFLRGSLTHPTATFYLLPTRVWELGTGCILALILHVDSVKDSNGASHAILGMAGLWMVMVSYAFVPTLNGGIAIAVIGTALVIAFSQAGLCNAILAQRPIVHTGKMSYSLYLWHWPVLAFVGDSLFGWHKVLCFVPIYVLSFASYYLVEKPTRRHSGIVPYISGCFAVVAGASAFLAFTPRVYDTSAFTTPHWYGKFYDLAPSGNLSEEFERIVATIETPKRLASPDAFLQGGIVIGEGASNSEIVVLGDSHGVMWSDAIRSATDKRGVKTSFYSMNGVSPFVSIPIRVDQPQGQLTSEQKFDYDLARLKFIKKWQPQLVIVCSAWNGKRESDAADLLDFLEQHAKQVLLIEQPPEVAAVGRRNLMQYLCYLEIRPELGVKKYLPAIPTQKGRELVRRLSASHPRVTYVPTYDLYIRDNDTLVLDGKEVLYVDNDHLTTFGARLAVPRIEKAISEALDSDGATNR